MLVLCTDQLLIQAQSLSIEDIYRQDVAEFKDLVYQDKMLGPCFPEQVIQLLRDPISSLTIKEYCSITPI